MVLKSVLLTTDKTLLYASRSYGKIRDGNHNVPYTWLMLRLQLWSEQVPTLIPLLTLLERLLRLTHITDSTYVNRIFQVVKSFDLSFVRRMGYNM